MSKSSLAPISRMAVQSRRQEIEQRLAATGLVGGPRRRLPGEGTIEFAHTRSRRLRLALEDLGRLFSAFGLYMSTRADLWAVEDCLELAAIPDKAAPAPSYLIKKLLGDELDHRTEKIFSEFEPRPFESRLLFQSHFARLNNGLGVIVKVIPPELETELALDIDLLPVLKSAFAGCGVSHSAFASAAADFRHLLQKQNDFVNEARDLEALEQDAEEYDALRAPLVQKRYCTSKVLVVERLAGIHLIDLPPFRNGPAGDAEWTSLASPGFERNDLARLLCEVWLRQALLGRAFSVEPRPENVLVTPGKQIAFTGGVFASLPKEPRGNLWDYLVAAANDDSDKACACLLREMLKDRLAKDDVRQRFRQAMPFRDGGWDARGDCHSLAELLFVQWRFASECGFTPLMHLPPFFRGLFSVADVARRIAPEIDPLAEGMRDLRLLTGLAQFSKMFSRHQFADQVDKYSALMVDMPQTVDEALTSVSENRDRNKVPEISGDRPGARITSAVIAALLVVLAGLVLLARFVGPMLIRGAWLERIGAVAFVAVCSMLLRSAGGRRR